MVGQGRTIYVAGAGIAGLTLALALAKFGARVVVLERNPTIQEYGAGLQIGPNARRVLNQLGLDRSMSTKGFAPEGIDVYPFRAKKPLTTLRLGDAVKQRFGATYAVLHRADLVEMLYRACRRFANIDITFLASNTELESHARAAAASEPGDGRRAFAFVGADGVHSHTRTGILGGKPATYSGYVSWRALVDPDALPVAKDKTSLFFGPGFHAVCYPLPARRKLNLVLFLRESAEAVFGPNKLTAPSLSDRMTAGSFFETILKAGKDHWGCWPLSYVEQPSWHLGNVGLIGDAAHAMLPFQAQGAAMSIEDAAILAPLLITEPTGEIAFSRYEALRRPRVERVQKESAANGFRFHVPWPLSVARDAVVAAQGPEGHFRRLDWLYGYDAAPDVALPPRKSRTKSE